MIPSEPKNSENKAVDAVWELVFKSSDLLPYEARKVEALIRSAVAEARESRETSNV